MRASEVLQLPVTCRQRKGLLFTKSWMSQTAPTTESPNLNLHLRCSPVLAPYSIFKYLELTWSGAEQQTSHH